MAFNIILFCAGVIITWFITHLYYAKSSKGFTKLSPDLQESILQASGKALTIKDLNALIDTRVIDQSDSDSLPFKACPKCGSKNIVHDTDWLVDEEMGDNGYSSVTAGTPYPTVECKECGWKKTAIDEGHDWNR